ncbi:hypothetical protein ABVK25_003522 [Lepraria finkii]|uniref:3-beta hydroxysteroid dehydrogenase/isomerase domain-containing protein n=1 Tax=Lepraria finkii TaxID=1340010 RepID=A0ABR4BKM3_9LECA
MAKDLVLIFSGTGCPVYLCIVHAFKAGVCISTTVRRESAIAQIKAAPSVQAYLDDLEVVLIQDNTVDDAFLQALQGVTYALHVASPLPSQISDYNVALCTISAPFSNFKDHAKQPFPRPATSNPTQSHQPTIHGTTSILTSAIAVPTINRIVITSSILGEDENAIYDETTLAPPPVYR